MTSKKNWLIFLFTLMLSLIIFNNRSKSQEYKNNTLYADDSGFVNSNNYFSLGGVQWGFGIGNMYKYSGVQLGLLSKKKLYRINGFSINGVFGEIEYVNGFVFGLLTTSVKRINGINLGGLGGSSSGICNGIQTGIFATSTTKSMNGISLAFIHNNNYKANGIIASSANISKLSNGINLAIFVIEVDTMNGIAFAGRSAGFTPILTRELTQSKLGNGILIFPINSYWRKVNGISISLYNKINKANGMTLGVYNNTQKSNGLALGIYNKSSKLNGAAVGIVNEADTVNGVQFGLWNVIKSNPKALRKLPIINFSF